MCLSGYHVVAQTLGYRLVYTWGCLVKFQGGGIVLKSMLMLNCGFDECLDRGLYLSFKAQRLPQIEINVYARNYRCLSKLSVSLKLQRGLSSLVS